MSRRRQRAGESRNYPYDASMENLAKAYASEKWHPPRPWRSKEEGLMIRRYVLLWLTCRDASRPSGRDWAKQLGISHTWLQKVVREFKTDPSKLRRIEAYGYPTLKQLGRAQKHTRRMKERGELRSHGERKREASRDQPKIQPQ